LISGGGTTLKNLIDKRDRGELNVDFGLVISSNPKAGGLAFASAASIPQVTIQQRDFGSAEAYGDALFTAIRGADAGLVVMGGFVKYLPMASDFVNRVVNIHPSLIPAFCGKGYYGSRVHEAVLAYGAKVSGCTVHFVDEEFDHGPIILQRVVPVRHDDTVETLASRVFAAECEALPEAITAYAEGRLRIEGRVVHVSSR
jgi:phosphoribosylglycinamide formyltransferase-1